MTRTHLFLGTAAALAVAALLIGPRSTRTPSPAPTYDPPPVEPAVANPASLSVRLSPARVPVGTSERSLVVEVTGRARQSASRSPLDLALVLDRSGSMAGEKLREAKSAALALIGRLTPADRLAIIHYGSDVKMFPSRRADAEGRAAMARFVEGIEESGGTDLYAGLETGIAQVAQMAGTTGVRHVLLMTDGVPTSGITDSRQIIALAQQAKAQGISVSTFGLGRDFDPKLMNVIAVVGGGHYVAVQQPEQLTEILGEDLTRTGDIEAQSVRLELHLADGVQLLSTPGGDRFSTSNDGRTTTLELPDLSAGRTIRLVERLRVTAEREGAVRPIATLRLRAEDPSRGTIETQPYAVTAHVSDQPVSFTHDVL